MPLTRRKFLIAGLELGVAGSCLSPALAANRAVASSSGERSLVVLQLTGANDGLNTVVPHRQHEYQRARPTLALPASTLHRLDDDHGLHESAAGLAELYAEGALAIVHGVGCPDPDRSHFRSMAIWHSAQLDAAQAETGWVGRLADRIDRATETEMPSLHIGAEALPLAMRGRRWFAPTLRDPNGLQLTSLSTRHAECRASALERPHSEPASREELAFLREAARTSYATAERMQGLASRADSVAYPTHELARKLRLVARLLGGGFGTRVYYVTHDGYDTHARQAPAHAALLSELSGALHAFQRDLAAMGRDREVLVLVFSEFGRRVEENGSRGTDHGAGAPVFLVGSGVRGGMHGVAPDLSRLVDGDLRVDVDFRSIYAAIERHWFGVESHHGVAPMANLFAEA